MAVLFFDVSKFAMMLSFSRILCFFCKAILHVDEKRPTIVTVYSSAGSFQSRHFVKRCLTKKCQAHYHYSYFTRYNVFYADNMLAKFYYDDSLQKDYFLASSCSAFKTDFLKSFFSDMFLCPEYSFHQKSMNFNLNVPTGNAVLSPKRYRDAFFQLALLEMWKLFNSTKSLSSLIQSHDVDRNITDLMPSLKQSFREYYSKHHCDISGCGTVMGFDADAKVESVLLLLLFFCCLEHVNVLRFASLQTSAYLLLNLLRNYNKTTVFGRL